MSRALVPVSPPGGVRAVERARSKREETVEDRIRDFRRRVGGTVAMLAVLAVVNLITTPFFPWVIFPAIGFAVMLANRLGALWAEGVSVRDIFSRRPREEIRRPRAQLGEPLPRAAAHAERTRAEMADLVAGLAAADRSMLPAVMPTVDRLVERIGLLAISIARLDRAVQPGALDSLDARIASSEAKGESGARTLALLQRQRESLRDLLERRTLLRAQLDSASLALENLRLQVVKLRSAGVQSALENVTSATQEAHALAREIGHVLDAAAELRAMDRGSRGED